MVVKLLIYGTILSLFSTEWLVNRLHFGGRVLTWVPEMFSLATFIYVVLYAASRQSFSMRPKYFLLLVVYVLQIVMGLFVNQVDPGTMFAGLRTYFRHLPFFLLPCVYDFDEKEMRDIGRFFLLFALIQCPVAIYQRLFSYAGVLSGDPICGTIGENMSGVLTIVLTMTSGFLVTYYLRARMRFALFVVLLGILLFPVTLNETKISFVLLPLVFVLPFIFSSRDRYKMGKLLPLLFLAVFSFITLKVVYNAFMVQRWGYGIETFVKMKGRLSEYAAMRLGPMQFAFDFATDNPQRLMFGVGIGNVSSSFSDDLAGEYAKKYGKAQPMSTGTTLLLWEVGVGGLLVYLTFLFLLWFDAVRRAGGKDFYNVLAYGTSIMIVFAFGALLYVNPIRVKIIQYFFWFMCGFIASNRYWNRRAEPAPTVVDAKYSSPLHSVEFGK